MKKIYSLLIIALAVSSCVDLEEKLYNNLPKDAYPENEVQGALITGPVYEPMREMLDNGGWWFAQEVPSDEVTFPTRHTDWDDGGKWRVLHEHTWTNSTEAVNTMWSRFYQGVGEANRLLEQLGEDNEDAGAKATVAKIKIMRAYYYYLLIDNYGDVPFVTSFADAEEYPSKDDKAVIWTSIVQDVVDNAVNLGDGTSKNAVTKGMAYSLLAKLYLNAEVYTGTAYWAEAEAACDSVLDLSYSLEAHPLSPFVTDNSLSSENIFTIPYDEDTYQGFNLHMRTLHYDHNTTFDMTAGPWNGCAAQENHYLLYEEADIRRNEGFLVGQQYDMNGKEIVDQVAGSNLIIDPYIPALQMDLTYTYEEIRMSGARVQKFEIKMGAKDNLSNDFPVFRLADAMLMKAEAMLRQSKSAGEALTYVNPIRERAGVSSWTGADLTLESLLEERGREMFFEGHRRQDQIRFGTFNAAWWEKSASTADRNTFPIPQWVLDSNPNLSN